MINYLKKIIDTKAPKIESRYIYFSKGERGESLVVIGKGIRSIVIINSDITFGLDMVDNEVEGSSFLGIDPSTKVIKNIAGKFPDFERIVPKSYKETYEVSAESYLLNKSLIERSIVVDWWGADMKELLPIINKGKKVTVSWNDVNVPVTVDFLLEDYMQAKVVFMPIKL
jgi:hypothetical protein